MRPTFAACAAWLLVSCASVTPETNAVAFLAREVPAWQPKNKCYSCHNNGDAARALFSAKLLGYDVGASLDATANFLRRPEAWDSNGPDGEFNDRALADLQFAFALAEGAHDPVSLGAAATRLRKRQQADGSFGDDAGGMPGGPITWGRTLATAAARRVLRATGDVDGSSRAEAWLRAKRPVRVPDAAALILSGAELDREACLELLRRGRQPDGGWGPYVESRSEVFDTALAVLALQPFRERKDVAAMIEGGRRWLIAAQSADGSWPETTRPSGAVSYAHRLSTSGWATLALLSTGAGHLKRD